MNKEVFNGTEYILPPLPYEYAALEPYIDEATVRLHHDKHHAAYVAGANAAIAKLKEMSASGDMALITHWVRQLAFHESGHLLHAIMWNNLAPKEKISEPSTDLMDLMNKSFGGYEQCVRMLKAASVGVEGSGWGILCYDPASGLLRVLGIEKHQNLTTTSMIPLLVVDVWEHAYYLKQQNNRAAYVESYMEIVNWDDVSQRLSDAMKSRS